jgi:type IV secretory pathway VirJ component
VDLPQYLRGLAASGDGCHYVVAELEALSQRLQRELGLERYRSPLLAGEGAGGTLAYAALAQAPPATVGGAVAVDPAPSLGTGVPLCAGAPSRPVPGGFAYDAGSSLPAPFQSVADGSLAAAVEPLLAADGAGRADGTARLPLVELPAAHPDELFAVIFSGDGGWRDLDREVGRILAERGVPVVGVDSLRYFWKAKTPDQVARDLSAILADARTRFGTPKVVLVGYSFGAGILPFAYNRLPAADRDSVVQLSLLGLEPTAEFEFRVGGWLGAESRDALPVLPELTRIDPALVQCFYGEDEHESLCRATELERAERIGTSGGHHFDGDYRALAGRILEGARRRLGSAGGGSPAPEHGARAHRATTPATPPEISAATSVSTNGTASPPGEAM